jgi:Cu/Ag efflux protein CusF
MRSLVLAILMVGGQLAMANPPPENYPLVNGVVRKIDVASGQITLKHEAIPNLNMPGMTMPFQATDPQILQGLKVGDKVHFAADQNADGDLIVLWIEKVQPSEIGVSTVFCKGVAATSPKTNVEMEIRADKFSTIRYEFAEGSLKGTAYINSIGRMALHKRNGFYLYRAGTGKLDSKLIFKMADNKITQACFYNYSAGMNYSPVECSFEN